MGTRERRQRERDAVRRDILDAAGRIFAEEGYRRATMRRIAEEIEYSPTAIYLHFRDKDQLLQAVCEEAFSELAVTLERLRKRPATPLGYLRGCLRTHIDFGLSHRDQYIVAFMNPSQGLGNAPFGRPLGSPAFDVLRESVRACAESGDIRTADVDTTAQALWAAVHGLTSLLITMQDVAVAFRQALIEHMIDTLIAGLQISGAPAAESAEAAAPARPAVPASPSVARQSPPAAPRARSYYLD